MTAFVNRLKTIVAGIFFITSLFSTAAIGADRSVSNPLGLDGLTDHHHCWYGTWHTKNFGPSDHAVIDGTPKCYLDSLLDGPNKLQMKFSSTLWKKSGGNNVMTIDLFHSYPIVGMMRSEVHDLLGKPIQFQPGVANQYPWADPDNKDLEWYQLSFPPCGSGVADHLELSYLDDKVNKFRCVAHSSCSDFEYWQTCVRHGVPIGIW